MYAFLRNRLKGSKPKRLSPASEMLLEWSTRRFVAAALDGCVEITSVLAAAVLLVIVT
jgi:hypothetical protein